MTVKNLDVEFLLDKSGSMHTLDCAGGKSRWQYGRETTEGLAHAVMKYDDDGITVVPFAGSYKVYENVTPSKVSQIFSEQNPGGATNTAEALKNRLDAYFSRKASGSKKPLLLLALTDGEPTDQEAVTRVIIEATKKMDEDGEIAISFIQVGKDEGAAKFLQHLDDNLVSKGAKFDIVDTLKIDETENFSVEELIEKAFND